MSAVRGLGYHDIGSLVSFEVNDPVSRPGNVFGRLEGFVSFDGSTQVSIAGLGTYTIDSDTEIQVMQL